MSAPIGLEEAQARLFALAETRLRGTETLPVDEALGRFLAAPLIARRTQPASDLSMMDGFAVAGSGPWRIIGESRAGLPFSAPLRAGEVVRISTGAAVPEGNDGIVLVEDASIEGVMLIAPPGDSRWIRRRGFDFAEGQQLLETGHHIGPAQIALARAAGHAAVEVAHRPSVAIIECGDELVADPVDCPAHLVPASNGAMVAAMARTVGAHARRIGPLPDDRAVLAREMDNTADADVLVTTAGASVGQHDHVRAALDDCGAEISFWRVAIRPGKPLLVGRRGQQIVLGLPGNPVSSYVTAFLFLLPLLRMLQGAARPLPSVLPLPLAEPVASGGDRREFRRARLVDGRAMPLTERDSSALGTLGQADLLIDRPIGSAAAPADSIVPCYWIGNGVFA